MDLIDCLTVKIAATASASSAMAGINAPGKLSSFVWFVFVVCLVRLCSLRSTDSPAVVGCSFLLLILLFC